ncbi:hypothetical protein [Thomasclavelia cocleata]|jgi:hypothetical protein|uniref:hypothetical protein n=1 Tax=Thomasclavelia cocleata TaxID=69824 RepID=UPI00241D7AEB|nr:hypothetical protein [Thomasclavelia cocleata]MCI9630419.1 hypothetical protein [Thomasclavelia cocleata]
MIKLQKKNIQYVVEREYLVKIIIEEMLIRITVFSINKLKYLYNFTLGNVIDVAIRMV